MALEFGVLGPIEVCRAGARVGLGGPQQRRIIAALTAERGHVVPVDALVEVAWPDAPPDGARRTVMTYVSRLRLALGDGHVVTQNAGYRLVTDDEAIDAVRFERLVEQAAAAPPTQAVALLDTALSLWRGSAYGEFADEWWALPHATRLEELRIAAGERRAEALIALGEPDRAAADLERVLATNPLRERSVAELMRAYEAAGRHPDALRAYARYRGHLVEETGLEPSAALRQLQSLILTGGAKVEGPAQATRGYTLGRVVGQGAFATVYRSTQPGVGREVAVKVIRAELADNPEFVRRFETEAQLVAHLEHPHIVPLYDFWREPGGAYLVFRLLRGGTVQDLLRRDGPCTLDRVDRLVNEVGGALATAHASGVVHRDIKPTNILLDETGNAYLADFGVAFAEAADGDPVRSSSITSSPVYASPEQLRRAPPSPLGDQYSFATLVWELLAGVPAFDGADVSAVLQAKLGRPVASLGSHRPDVPGGLDAVLQRATATRPEDRYPDMAGFVDAWHEALRPAVSMADEFAVPLEGARHSRFTQEPINPYPGLRSFGEADAPRFRGRDELAAKLAEEVQAWPFVTVVGASGSGKSSLVSAGLLPRLREAGMRVAAMVPGDDPLGQLRLGLLAAAVEEPEAGDVAAMVRSVAAQGGGPLLVVIDQLEELWTLSSARDRDKFTDAMAAVVGDPAVASVHVVVAIRADFFDRPLTDAALGPLIAAHPFAVTPMSASELRDAVVAPAAAQGVVFEPGLDGALVAEVTGQPASLPLLQFTLSELFERRDGRVISRKAYESIGGIAGALAARAEELYATLDPEGQDAAHRLLLRLVVPGEVSEDTRRRVRVSDLPRGTTSVAEVLISHRLLVSDRDPLTREPTIEVAHESLLRSWPRLMTWLDDDRQLRRQVQHIGEAAQTWAAAGRQESELYRGARLDAAVHVLQTRPQQLTDLERDFIEVGAAAAAATRDRDRRGRRRLRRAFVASLVALVLAIVAGSVALVQRHEASRQADAAEVARLVALSQSLTGTKRDVAMLLALEAARRQPGAATTGALQTALYTDPSFLGYLRSGTTVAGAIEFTPDGRYLYASSQENGVAPVRVELATGRASTVPLKGLDADSWVSRLVPTGNDTALVTRVSDDGHRILPVERIDLVDGHVLGAAPVPAEAGHVALSPDGKRAAVTTVGQSGTRSRVVVLDVSTMSDIASIDQPGPAFLEPLGRWFSQSAWIDDRRLVVAGPSGRLLIWAPDTGKVVRRLNDPPAADTGFPSAVQVTPDHTQVVVAGSTLMAYDLTTGARSWPAAKEVGGAIAIDPIGHKVWAQEPGSGSSRMFAYDLATGERAQATLDGQHGTVCDAKVSPDSTMIALSSCNEGTVAVWALDGATVTGAPLESSDWASSEDMWSPDGYVAMFRTDGRDSVEVVNARTGARLPALGVTASASNSPTFRPDGVLQTVDGRNHVVDFDPATRATHDTGIVLRGGSVTANIALRGSHLSIYGLDQGPIQVIDTAKSEIVKTIHTDLVAVYGVGWSRDGRRVFAAGQTEEAKVYDLATGREVATLPTPAANLVVSPVGHLMATAAFNGTIRFYDTSTLKQVGQALDGGTSFAAQIQFTPDGRTLITSGLDNTMRLFDVTSRRQLGVPISIASWGAAVAPDSQEFAITRDRGVGRLALDRNSLLEAACRAAGRNLTAGEWERYVGGSPHRLCPG